MKNKTTQFEINNKQSRAGAKACLEGMNEVDYIAYKLSLLPSCATVEQELQAYVDSQQAMIRNAEPNLSPFMVGFLAAIGEYISKTKVIGGEPWLANGWKPWVAMTKKEEAADKKKLYAD